MNSDSIAAGWSKLVAALPPRTLHSGKDKSLADDGVYVSLDTLLNLRHSVHTRSKNTANRVQQGLSGEILSSRKGPGIEFEDIRPYLPGDDLRHVDWRVAARTGMPYTRRYTEDLEHHVMIVCDQRITMFFGSGATFKSYRAALLAAKMAWLALQQGHRFSGLVASETLQAITVNSPRRAVLEFCNSVAKHNNNLAVENTLKVSMVEILDAVHRRLKPGMSITVISDFSDLDQGSAIALAEITRRSELILRRVDDPLEQTMTVRGRVGISDGSQVKQVVVSGKVQSAYQKKRAMINQRLTDLVELSGATLLSSDCGMSV